MSFVISPTSTLQPIHLQSFASEDIKLLGRDPHDRYMNTYPSRVFRTMVSELLGNENALNLFKKDKAAGDAGKYATEEEFINQLGEKFGDCQELLGALNGYDQILGRELKKKEDALAKELIRSIVKDPRQAAAFFKAAICLSFFPQNDQDIKSQIVTIAAKVLYHSVQEHRHLEGATDGLFDFEETASFLSPFIQENGDNPKLAEMEAILPFEGSQDLVKNLDDILKEMYPSSSQTEMEEWSSNIINEMKNAIHHHLSKNAIPQPDFKVRLKICPNAA